MNLIRAASPGAGNAFYIEKLHHCLKAYTLDQVVIQLTEPSRVVTGFAKFETEDGVDLQCPQSVGNLACYTWNIHNNESNIKQITGMSTQIDKVRQSQIIISNWINYKVMQDVITMHYLCESFNVPVVFWSWFRPMDELFIEQYNWLKNKIQWIPGCAIDWIHKTNICSLPDGHWDAQAHSQIVDNWLYPQINI